MLEVYWEMYRIRCPQVSQRTLVGDHSHLPSPGTQRDVHRAAYYFVRSHLELRSVNSSARGRRDSPFGPHVQRISATSPQLLPEGPEPQARWHSKRRTWEPGV